MAEEKENKKETAPQDGEKVSKEKAKAEQSDQKEKKTEAKAKDQDQKATAANDSKDHDDSTDAEQKPTAGDDLKNQSAEGFEFEGQRYRWTDRAPKKILVNGQGRTQVEISNDEDLLILVLHGFLRNRFIKKIK